MACDSGSPCLALCASHRLRAAAAILALPSADLGPVDSPPCSGQRQAPRFVFIAVALHRCNAMGRRCRPLLLRNTRENASIRKAPQTCLGTSKPHIRTANPLICRTGCGSTGITRDPLFRPCYQCRRIVASCPACPLCRRDTLAPLGRGRPVRHAAVKLAAPGPALRLDRLALAGRSAAGLRSTVDLASHVATKIVARVKAIVKTDY